MPSSSYELLNSSVRLNADVEPTLERRWDLLDLRWTGLPESQDPSESTEASDCDIKLVDGTPGLTGESVRPPVAGLSAPTRRSDGGWLRRLVAMALAAVDVISGDWTRESGGDNGNSGKSSLNFDIVRRGTLEGRRIWIGCEDCDDCEY